MGNLHYCRAWVAPFPCGGEVFASTVCNFASERGIEYHPVQELESPTGPTSGVMCIALFIIPGVWIETIPGLIGVPKPDMD